MKGDVFPSKKVKFVDISEPSVSRTKRPRQQEKKGFKSNVKRENMGSLGGVHHLSHETNPLTFRLFNRDPYNGLLQSPQNWVV